jgi:hypothetical protein
MYPFVMLKLSDAVPDGHGCCMHHTGDNLRNPCGPTVNWNFGSLSLLHDRIAQLAVC